MEVIDSIEALTSIRPAWEALYQDDAEASIFLGPDWLLNWLAHFAADKTLRFLWLTENSTPIALFPFVIHRARWRGLPVRQLGYCLNAHSVRGGYLVRAPHADAAIRAAFQHLDEYRDWDMCVAEASPVSRPTLAGGVVSKRSTPRAPPWEHSFLSIETDWDTFYSSRSRDLRRTLRRSEHDLGQLGAVEFRMLRDSSDADRAIAEMCAIDAASWKAERGEIISAQTPVLDYYAGIVRTFAAAGKLMLGSLLVGGQAKAMVLALDDKGILYTLKTSYVMAVGNARISPGTLALYYFLQEVWRRQFRGIDFVSKHPYTEKWTRDTQFFCRELVFSARPYGMLLKHLEVMRNKLASRH
ncbi:MAG: GNAT family N-acetyltransferase [Gammaproteobacteria bacterium]